MEVIAPVHHALLACGSWRLASLPPFACRQTGFNGKLDSMANWGTEWTPNHFRQSFSHVAVIWASAEQFYSGVESGKTAVMQKLVRQPTRAPANPRTSKPAHQQTHASANACTSKPVNPNRPPVKLAESPDEAG